MRLSAFATPLLLASIAFARSPYSHLRRNDHKTDICANINADLVFSDVIIDGKPYVAGHLDVGICISQVKIFVESHNVTEAAVKVVGEAKVQATVTAMIKGAGTDCSYPQHAEPSCAPDDPCNFKCTDGFLAMPSKNPTSCQCPPHQRVCDGVCGHFHMDCGKKAPLSRRQNDPKCAEGLTMCGVPEASWGQAYKCVDTTSDSLTCGGCVKASPFGSPSTGGVNCRGIPQVDDVTCEENSCIVHSCKDGYMVTPANDWCIAIPKPDGNAARSFTPSGAETLLGSATGSTEGLKVSRDQLTEALSRGPGVSIEDKLVPRSQSSAALSHGASAISPLLSSTKGAGAATEIIDKRTTLAKGGQGVGAVTPVLGATGGVVTGIKSTPETTVASLRQGGTIASPVGAVSQRTSTGAKVTRGFAPIVGHNTNVVTSSTAALEKAGVKAPRDVTDFAKNGSAEKVTSNAGSTLAGFHAAPRSFDAAQAGTGVVHALGAGTPSGLTGGKVHSS